MKTLKWYRNCFLFLFFRRLLNVWPSEKKCFSSPPSSFFGAASLFYYLFSEKLERTKNHATSFTLKTIILQSYVAGLTFHKRSCILTFLTPRTYWDILCDVSGCLKQILKWAKFVFKKHLTFHLLIFDRMTPTCPWGRVIIKKKRSINNN